MYIQLNMLAFNVHGKISWEDNKLLAWNSLQLCSHPRSFSVNYSMDTL